VLDLNFLLPVNVQPPQTLRATVLVVLTVILFGGTTLWKPEILAVRTRVEDNDTSSSDKEAALVHMLDKILRRSDTIDREA
jgi:hypothetical protein